MKNAIWETIKFILRVVLLVGIPTVLTQLTVLRPQWGVYIGFGLLAIDKYIHKLPNEYRGLIPF